MCGGDQETDQRKCKVQALANSDRYPLPKAKIILPCDPFFRTPPVSQVEERTGASGGGDCGDRRDHLLANAQKERETVADNRHKRKGSNDHRAQQRISERRRRGGRDGSSDGWMAKPATLRTTTKGVLGMVRRTETRKQKRHEGHVQQRKERSGRVGGAKKMRNTKRRECRYNKKTHTHTHRRVQQLRSTTPSSLYVE